MSSLVVGRPTFSAGGGAGGGWGATWAAPAKGETAEDLG